MSELSCKEVFETQIPERLASKPEVAKSINASYQFNLSGEGGGDWVVDLTKEADYVTAGAIDNPGVTIGMKAGDFLDLVQGKLNGQMAMLSGKIKMRGAVALALKLQEILR